MMRRLRLWFSGKFRRRLSTLYKSEVGSPELRTQDRSEEDLLTFMCKGSSFNNVDPEKERDPPPDATPVTFPDYKGLPTRDWDESTAPDYPVVFSKIIRPVDVSDKHLEALNVEITEPCSANTLLPRSADGSSYFPSAEEPLQSAPGSYADATKVDAQIARNNKDYNDRLTELRVANDDGYRVITRSTKPGAPAPRLAHMRKFWEGLESISQYWDCSLDEYREASPSPTADSDGESSAKRAKLEGDTEAEPTGQNDEMSSPEARKAWKDLDDCDPDSLSSTDRKDLLDRVARAREKDNNTEAKRESISPQAAAKSRIRYKGRRTGTGRNAPDAFFANTVKALVEGVAWAFQCSLAAPKRMPVVQFGRLNQPVRQTAAVYRMPKDRKKARSGALEGPIMGLQIRPETDFVNDNGEPIEKKARMDLLRELGGLLQVAQERRREGRTETKPGDGKWYTSKPRWGGGTGGDTGKESDDNEISDAANELINAAMKGAPVREKAARRAKGRKTAAEHWKEIKPGGGIWDAKMEYTAIGKEPDSAYDEVFSVSALNHHVRILKLTIHGDYIDYLTTGELPSPLVLDRYWCRPRLQRTEWFDMFDVDQRVEAFNTLWAIMKFALREVKQAETQAEEGAKEPVEEMVMGDARMSGT